MTFIDQIRTAYNTVADDYHKLVQPMYDTLPFEKAMLGAFAELVEGKVADVGCGPGHLTAYMAEALGLDAFGIDLSPEMITVARREYPAFDFSVGSMLALDLPDGELGGVLASYSIIHMPPTEHPKAFSEFHRVLRPGGHVLVMFHVGTEIRHLSHAYGHDIDLDVHGLDPVAVTWMLEDAGFRVLAKMDRARSFEGERTDKCYIVAQRPPLTVTTEPTTNDA
ncbi:class I SAM-dependent methyltransferase [Kibdelosporangium lantanae]|uniref:Class I SAM-dependent methyltransferase n=1 Tax=Kibdelosporangium lantanae TaxID=1497396 RepID=A0ABW3MJU0_9PSEU